MISDVDSLISDENGGDAKIQQRPPIGHILLAACAISLFVYLGGSVGGQLVHRYAGIIEATDQAMVSALLLNIALILLIWRRTTDLSNEVDVYRQA